MPQQLQYKALKKEIHNRIYGDPDAYTDTYDYSGHDPGKYPLVEINAPFEHVREELQRSNLQELRDSFLTNTWGRWFIYRFSAHHSLFAKNCFDAVIKTQTDYDLYAPLDLPSAWHGQFRTIALHTWLIKERMHEELVDEEG